MPPKKASKLVVNYPLKARLDRTFAKADKWASARKQGRVYRPRGGKGSSTKGFRGEFSKKFSLLPIRKSAILPFTTLVQLNVNTGVASNNFGTEAVFSLNSIYKPLFAPAGLSVLRANGYGDMTQHYGRSCVYAVGVELEFYDPSQDGLVVGLIYQPSSTPQSITGYEVDQLDSKQLAYTKDISGTGSQKVKLNYYLPLHKIEGVSKLAFNINNDNYTAISNTSPTLQPWLRVAVANTRPVAGVSSTASVMCIVRIKYYTRFMDKITEPMDTYTS